ncbi:hypothetical protein GYMLUDRAFT_262896 [Collybiopsis luxurians FD-317 M1]|uniref:Uncharacterized protein n=1 Tax=Collybiopsis luxurians FD-317 M1 TaxID=944289 RepID=A0A0D0B388_9AGAR|nr:hypothetical protein GYMLUDRAFT_262896 [Collybiopsis luxurians FD-317 M1]
MPSFTDFSVFLGYTSIFCWLGAQFPQVLENIRRRSCEGIALPFLMNWFLGDVSNLIGCILTHQLPFQTWLATYFVMVDLTLCGQYFYYQWINPPRIRSRLRRMSVDRPPRYRTISAVASNVAAAAALAAQHEERVAPRRPSRWTQSSRETFFESSASQVDNADLDEGAFSALADSFHSESGHTLRGKQVSLSAERQRRGTSVGRYPILTRTPFVHPGSQSLTIDNTAETLARGRSMHRNAEHGHGNQVLPSASLGRSSRIKQGSSMVFLGVFAIFGLCSFSSTRHLSSFSSVSRTGQVLRPRAVDASYSAEHSSIPPFINVLSASSSDVHIPITISSSSTSDIPAFEPKSIENSNERIIGRIFAWVCTTLYLTSRLPQIWKNFVRKSVEGLSMYLFVFAFLGNVFYVASILTSPEVFQPPPVSSDFIKESIPYLLGSGGTLVFDISIVTQSFLYRSKPRRHRSRSRTAADEEGGLLAGDALGHSSQAQEEVDAQHSRTRTLSSAPVTA